MKCLIATGNPHKVEAIRRLLAGHDVEIVALSDFPGLSEPVEDGDSFLANALIKSRYYCRATGLLALADDSGLEVDALGGDPGVHSARYAGAETPHSDKMAKILQLLQGTPPEQRTARFRCVAAATFPDGREYHTDASMEGIIAEAPRGESGFGYDPIVFLPELDKTVAELSPEEKDEISHRGLAFRRLLPLIIEAGKNLSER